MIAMTLLFAFAPNNAMAADVLVIEGSIDAIAEVDVHDFTVSGADATSTMTVTLVCGNSDNPSEILDPVLEVIGPIASEFDDDSHTVCADTSDPFDSSIVEFAAGQVDNGDWTALAAGFQGLGDEVGPYTLTITLSGPGFINDIQVDIDIKPGSDPNSINTKSMGVVPVAILGSGSFDVTDIDVATLDFEGASPKHDLSDPLIYADHLQDVNLDGFVDLVSHYPQKDTSVCGQATGEITANLLDGTALSGSDSVRPLHCP